MEKFPKYIIEDGKLVIGKVTFHKELAMDKSKVKGGGWFRFDSETNTFTFSGDSHDFGKASFEDVKDCVLNKKIYRDLYHTRNIYGLHNFAYDTGTEIIKIE